MIIESNNQVHTIDFPPYVELYIYMYKDALKSTLRNYRKLKKFYHPGIDAVIITRNSRYEQFINYEKEFLQDLHFLLDINNNCFFNLDMECVIIRYFNERSADLKDIKRLAKKLLYCPVMEFYKNDTARIIRERKKQKCLNNSKIKRITYDHKQAPGF